MLGRYVAGTLLILGVAMLVAPREERAPVEVARAETTPLALPDPRPARADPLPVPAVATPAAAQAEPEVTFTLRQAQPREVGGIAALAGLEPRPTGRLDAQPAPAAEPAVHYVSGTRVNVRSGPSTSFAVISSVEYGDAVKILDDAGDGWSHIRIESSGTQGYMATRFLSDSLG